jgi:hypothetical protein
MKVSDYMAGQFANPSGLFGKLVVGNMLNRANIEFNKLVLEMLELKPEFRVLEVGSGSDKALREAGYEERGFTLYSPDQILSALTNCGFGSIEQRTIKRRKRGTFYVLKATKP